MSPAGRRLVLLRHGQTSWNLAGRAQGQADIELDECGHEQARAVAPYLSALAPAALWTSDLARARQTCSYLEKETGLSATQDARLREFHVGARQGLTMAEFAVRFPEAHAAWRADNEALLVPGAESNADVAARMHAALTEALAGLGPGETAVVVTHGASLRTGLVALLGWAAEQGAAMRGVDNCCWASVEEAGHGGRLRLTSYNRGGPGERGPGTPQAI
ncbi:MAG: histidine phosphatase family protein [Nocardioides sp.]